ncbi:MAG: acyltransferase [Phycisphaerales bacterium]|nr:acyltransferase [Phycisphaerales bacterium]
MTSTGPDNTASGQTTDAVKADLQVFRTNNFDLLRLGAAMQVAILHSAGHLNVGDPDSSWILSILHHFPGVPIFFFISGFLISRSYESNSRLNEYSRNRGFRIFPALWGCLAISLLLVWASGYFATIDLPWGKFLIWIGGQLTFVQFWNPDFMRGYGSGVLNGALWTICVELQFYVITPIIYFCLRRLPKRSFDKAIIALIVFFILVHLAYFKVLRAFDLIDGELLFFKLFNISFPPWFYMFLIGVWAQRNFEMMRAFTRGPIRLLVFLTIFGVFHSIMMMLFGKVVSGQYLDPMSYILLCLCILSAAYTMPELAGRILRRNDISYGVYIYHMPIVNLLIWFGLVGTLGNLALAIASTIVLATISWVLIERPAMKLKRHALNPLKSSRAKTAG